MDRFRGGERIENKPLPGLCTGGQVEGTVKEEMASLSVKVRREEWFCVEADYLESLVRSTIDL